MTDRDDIRDILQAHVLPHAEDWEERGHIPAQAWRTLGATGLFDPPDFATGTILLEELGRTGYAGIRAAIGVHSHMAVSYIDLFGSPDQKRHWLAPARRGELVAALAITEADAGSDLSRLSTRATVTEGGFEVSGEKHFVSNGTQAGFYVTLVKTRDSENSQSLSGTSLLIIPADSPGISRRPQPTLGWRSADVSRIGFDRVFVPETHLIGRRDRAFMMLMRALDLERLAAGFLALGGAYHCLDLTHRFVRQHRVKGAPLSHQQAVRHRLAELTCEYELVRHYAFGAADRYADGRLDTRSASIVKLRATELAASSADACLRFHGARGYLSDSTAARLHRDAIAGTIAAGASEILRDMVFDTGWP